MNKTACKSVFITATDTDAGKTFVSSLLLQGIKQLKHTAIGVKPIAAGANAQGQNSDAVLLRQHSSYALPNVTEANLANKHPYAWYNPILLQQPVAPHLAAQLTGQQINETDLNQALQSWQQQEVDLCVIEGAGGWLLPLNKQRYLSDWVVEHKLPVILVIGMKLGCLNHAMLTIREIERSGCHIIGWVANCVDPDMQLLGQNVDDLQQRIAYPCLAVLPWYSASASTRADKTNQAVKLAQSVLALM
ncbi:dethiobiotin synthase [Rheinheimera sp. WS51]|uniref:dethiobiotin synthase n=1 Tax=Rheinheimera sp. WS51 TaxID=3425886 RepID=UPI003D91F0E9